MQTDCSKFFEGFEKSAINSNDAVKMAFADLPGGIKNPFNGVISLMGGMSQRITTGLNALIVGINRIGFDLPGFLGGGSFRPNISLLSMPEQIPLLARGGIVDHPTLALIGERGKEVVMPLENNTGWISDLANTIGSVVAAQMAINQGRNADSGFHSDRRVQLNIDGFRIAEAIIDDLVEVARVKDLNIFGAYS
jgi:hypothetical protein